MKKRGYIFTNKRNSNRAIMAVILGMISLASLAAAVVLSYQNAGQTTARHGMIGLFAAVYSLTGFILGLATVFKKNYYRIFPVLGIILNGAVLISLGLMIYMGAK